MPMPIARVVQRRRPEGVRQGAGQTIKLKTAKENDSEDEDGEGDVDADERGLAECLLVPSCSSSAPIAKEAS